MTRGAKFFFDSACAAFVVTRPYGEGDVPGLVIQALGAPPIGFEQAMRLGFSLGDGSDVEYKLPAADVRTDIELRSPGP